MGTRTAVVLALAVALSALGPGALGGATHQLTVAKSGDGNGQVTSDLAGIDCGPTCAVGFPEGATVTLTADPNDNSSFTGWTGDCSGTGDCQVTMNGARNVGARFDRSARPDAWIKLCGLSDGCTINPLPNPWKGKDVHNSTAAKQTIKVRMEDGEGVRFWILVENDGAEADTFTVEGCQGTSKFKINKVQLGWWKRPNSASEKITTQFKTGTAKFDFPAKDDREVVKLTLNIVAPTTAEGVTYRCPITIRSEIDDTVVDTLAAEMTTY